MDFDTKVEVAGALGAGVWSLATVLLFAGGKYQAAYSMLAVGTIVGTSLAVVRIIARPPIQLERGA